MRKQDEFRLACVVADYLARTLPADAIWSAFPAGENRSAITGARLKRMGLAKGWPDLLIIYRGNLIGIELKVAGGSISPEQKHIGAMFIAHGFAWGIARSLDDVEAILTEQGIPLRGTILRSCRAIAA